jgi:hypothetical protein
LNLIRNPVRKFGGLCDARAVKVTPNALRYKIAELFIRIEKRIARLFERAD